MPVSQRRLGPCCGSVHLTACWKPGQWVPELVGRFSLGSAEIAALMVNAGVVRHPWPWPDDSPPWGFGAPKRATGRAKHTHRGVLMRLFSHLQRYLQKNDWREKGRGRVEVGVSS